MSEISIISVYVSHNSEAFIKKFGDRHKHELGEKTFLVNSSTYPIDQDDFPGFEVINVGDNIGFSAANNLAIRAGLEFEPEYFLIINPDVYLPAGWMKKVMHEISQVRCEKAGLYTVPLLGYDFEKDIPTGKIDSLGLSHTWYGRWHDVLQGHDAVALDVGTEPYPVEAACGALMLIEKDTVCSLLERDGYVFNESYFMYKEDVELSLRIKRLGKELFMLPVAPVFHCRGWAADRSDSPYWARYRSARNELEMHMSYYWRFVPYSIIKYIYVKYIERVMMGLLSYIKVKS